MNEAAGVPSRVWTELRATWGTTDGPQVNRFSSPDLPDRMPVKRVRGRPIARPGVAQDPSYPPPRPACRDQVLLRVNFQCHNRHTGRTKAPLRRRSRSREQHRIPLQSRRRLCQVLLSYAQQTLCSFPLHSRLCPPPLPTLSFSFLFFFFRCCPEQVGLHWRASKKEPRAFRNVLPSSRVPTGGGWKEDERKEDKHL